MLNYRGSPLQATKPAPKYKYTYNSKLYDLTAGSSSLDSKIGSTRAKEPISTTLPDKIKSTSNFSLEQVNNNSANYFTRGSKSSSKKSSVGNKDLFKLPQISRLNNPEEMAKVPPVFYMGKIYRAFKSH